MALLDKAARLPSCQGLAEPVPPFRVIEVAIVGSIAEQAGGNNEVFVVAVRISCGEQMIPGKCKPISERQGSV
ncbi:hypothetical protein [Pseudomonas sp. ATCC 13867]|uniref:hypothetical protein n=1 Tax=Pseudomonas sp. ATCC 13867 TaxID=1294143 RepID=UPI00138B12D1|nr:hypothetical protein [Pseudomonas sp. ATCC 13867]